MAYVTPLYGGSDEQIDYRLGITQHGCDSDVQLGYRTDAKERPLTWIGEGLQAFGVDGLAAGAELTKDQHDMARNLMRGQHPVTGEQLVKQKVAVPAAAKLSLGPLVAAVNEAAHARGVSAEALFAADARLAKAWAAAERGVARRGGRAIARVDEASALAEAAGLDPAAVWGGERVGEARAALWETRPVVGADGRPVLDPDGRPVTEMVEARTRVGIVGYDIGITLPKSLSVLLAMAPDELTRRVEGVYATAAGRTFDWTEGRTSYVKRGHHGDGKTATHEASSGFSGWVMTHRAARPVGELPVGDPHWHVHITVANMARAKTDGAWLTVASGGRDLMRHAPAIDKVTQAQIRAELRAEFGISFARAERTGLWEVEHIPEEAITLFSKRGAQVNAVLEQLGYTPGTVSPKESRVLTRACRSGKGESTSLADVTLREYWRAQALSAGYDPADWMTAVFADYSAGLDRAGERAAERANETMSARHGATLDDVIARLTDPEDGLTARTRRFSHLDALAAVADALPHGATVDEVEQLTDLVLQHPKFVRLPTHTGRDGVSQGEKVQLAGSHDMAGGQMYSTGDVTAAEQTILDTIKRARAERDRATVDPGVLAMAVSVTEAAQGYALSGEQRAALDALVLNGRGVECILGAAGAGKTTLMRTARVAYEGQGLVVAGAATAAKAVQELAAESGIDSRTVAQWLYRIQTGQGLASVDVLVLDEANLTDDRARAALYRAAQASGTKIVEIGDPKQLRSVGCGSMFGYINAALEGPTLVENRRQRSEDERAALAAYRDGRYSEALTSYAAGGQVVARHTSDEGVAAMVAAWMHAARGAPDAHTRADGLLMLAKTNEQVGRINEAVQAVREEEGQLGEGRTFLLPGGRQVTFRVGDQAILRRNDRTAQAVQGEGVLNGYRAIVIGVEEAEVRVEWHQPCDAPGQAPHTTVCTPQYIADDGLFLGYALTTHNAEGMSVGAAWDRPDGTRNEGTVLAWGPGMDNPGLYVSLSRDKGRVLLFGSLEELEGDGERLRYGTPRDQAELTDRVVAAMAERAENTATTADDRPVLVDLGQAPAQETQRRDRTKATAHDAAVELGLGDTEQEPALSQAPVDTEQHPEQQREQPQVEVTEEHRRRWDELKEQIRLHRGDPVAQQAAIDAKRAYAELIGQDRAERLFAQDMDRFKQWASQRRDAEDRAAAEAETRRQWQQRPHSRLTDAQLEQAIVAAQLQYTGFRNEAARAQAQLVEREPEVAAGRGPRVAQLDRDLSDLRRLTELDEAVGHAQQRWSQTRGMADWRRGQAEIKRREAHNQPWYRSGRRDQLLAEATDMQAHADADRLAAAQLKEQLRALAVQRDEQHARTLRGNIGRTPGQARYHRDRAESSHQRLREQQQRVDEAELERLRQAASPVNTEQASARHTALVEEAELRATMGQDQVGAEQSLRNQWLREQQHIKKERAAEQEKTRMEGVVRSRPTSYTQGPTRGHGFSR